jgi:hypothetical protein
MNERAEVRNSGSDSVQEVIADRADAHDGFEKLLRRRPALSGAHDLLRAIARLEA